MLGVIFRILAAIGGLLARMAGLLRATTWGAWLVYYLITFAGGLIGKILGLLGVTLAVNSWATPVLTPLVSEHLLNLPPEWIQLLALTKIDQALTVIISAIGIAVASRVHLRKNPLNDWGEPSQ